MPLLLQVSDLRIRHGQTTLVEIPRLDISHGERVAVLGRSGSGKSLTAAAITDTLPPTMQTSGTVILDGSPVGFHGLGTAGTALVRQDSADALNPLVTVNRQLAIPEAGKDSSHVRRLLADVGLDEPDRILSSYPAELSGGQRQRLCIALGIICQQPLLVTDECTTALDTVSQAAVVRTLHEHRTQDALLFITHDLAVAAELCDRAVVMDHGHIVEDGPLSGLMENPGHPVTTSLVNEARTRYGWAA